MWVSGRGQQSLFVVIPCQFSSTFKEPNLKFLHWYSIEKIWIILSRKKSAVVSVSSPFIRGEDSKAAVIVDLSLLWSSAKVRKEIAVSQSRCWNIYNGGWSKEWVSFQLNFSSFLNVDLCVCVFIVLVTHKFIYTGLSVILYFYRKEKKQPCSPHPSPQSV